MQLFSLFIYLFFLRLEQSVLSRSVRIKLTQLVEGESQTQMCRVCVITRLHGSRRAFSIQRRWHHSTVVFFFFRGLFSDSPLSGKSRGRVQLQSDKWRLRKKKQKNGFLCVPIAVAQAGGRGGEGIWVSWTVERSSDPAIACATSACKCRLCGKKKRTL